MTLAFKPAPVYNTYEAGKLLAACLTCPVFLGTDFRNCANLVGNFPESYCKCFKAWVSGSLLFNLTDFLEKLTVEEREAVLLRIAKGL